MSSFNSYPKIYNVGHAAVEDIFKGTVLVEEKIDGSQFSFGLIEGRLRMKSHHQDISDIVGEYGLFTEAIAYVRELYAAGKLKEGYTYRGEVLQKPLHNKLAYERVPRHNIIGFDIATGDEKYLGYADKAVEFQKLDLEVVPYHYYGTIPNLATMDTLLTKTPMLGGKGIEGVVFKAYGRFTEDGKTMMAKYVNPSFRELKQTGEFQPGKDFIQELIDTYRSEARWDKAIQRMTEAGKLQKAPQDIGPIMGVIIADLKEEEGKAIAAKLMKRYWPHVARGATGGFAEYYKRKLAEGAFKQDEEATTGSEPSPNEAAARAGVQGGGMAVPEASASSGQEVPASTGGGNATDAHGTAG